MVESMLNLLRYGVSFRSDEDEYLSEELEFTVIKKDASCSDYTISDIVVCR